MQFHKNVNCPSGKDDLEDFAEGPFLWNSFPVIPILLNGTPPVHRLTDWAVKEVHDLAKGGNKAPSGRNVRRRRPHEAAATKHFAQQTHQDGQNEKVKKTPKE